MYDGAWQSAYCGVEAVYESGIAIREVIGSVTTGFCYVDNDMESDVIVGSDLFNVRLIYTQDEYQGEIVG